VSRAVWLLALLAACDGCGPRPGESPSGDSRAESDAPGDTGDSSPDLPPAPVSALSVEQHAEVATILELSWTQEESTEAAWVEYRFDDQDWWRSPERALEAGAQREVLLGIPAETPVELRLVNRDDALRYGPRIEASTGALPGALATPTLLVHDPTLASEHPWVLGSVDVGNSWYQGPCYSFVLDRQGRVVWYHLVSGSRLNLFTQVAADGSHVLIEGSTHYVWDDRVVASVDRMTLDKRWVQTLELEDLGFSYDEIEGGSILYNAERDRDLLVERYPDGSEREIFDCSAYAQQEGFHLGTCAVNSVVHNPDQGTVFWSMYLNDTVVEVDYESGEVVRRFGQVPGGWAFDPSWTEVDYQHYPNYSPDGTIVASTHSRSRPGVQYAHEYVVDDSSDTLTAIWTYGDEVLSYANYGGEAFRLPGGNTFITYGTDGAIREVTPDKRTAWQLEWPVDPNTHLVGHFSFVDDLYALNRGPAEAPEPSR
jgi:hypothetical protein